MTVTPTGPWELLIRLVCSFRASSVSGTRCGSVERIATSIEGTPFAVRLLHRNPVNVLKRYTLFAVIGTHLLP